MRRSHGSTGDGVGGIFAANPGGENAQTWCKDVVARSVVGEVCSAVIESGSTNSDGKLSGSWRVVAGIGVIVTSGHSEVDTSSDSTINCTVKSGGFAASKRHVGSRALEALLSFLYFLGVRVGGPFNTLDDICHASRAIGFEDLDSVDIGLLSDAILGASNRAGAVSSVSISILISLVSWDSLTPVCSASKVNVVDAGSGINNVNIDALTRIGGIEVFTEVAES